MFHHHTENSPSTGEPPTPPLNSLIAEDSFPREIPLQDHRNRPAAHPEGPRPPFQERTMQQRMYPDPDDVIQWNRDSISTPSQLLDLVIARQIRDEALVSQSDSGVEVSPTSQRSPLRLTDFYGDDNGRNENTELCDGCQQFVNPCDCQSYSSIDYCDRNSNEQLSLLHRPSTLPMEIPMQRLPIHSMPSRSSPRRSAEVRPRFSHSVPNATTPLTPELPVIFPRSYPRMWPSAILSWSRQNTYLNALRQVGVVDSTENRPRQMTIRNRLRNVHCSSSSEPFVDLSGSESDNEDFNEVFVECVEMVEEDLPVLPINRRRLNSAASVQPLPDLILQSSPSTRRYRSASVNLPPDHAVLQSIGRSLRRMSDEFQPRGFQHGNERPSPECPTFPIFSIFKRSS